MAEEGKQWPLAPASCETLHIAINSLASYHSPRTKLLSELVGSNVPMSQVHVFLGGSSEAGAPYKDKDSGAWFHPVDHNSVDFTGLVYITEHMELFHGVTQWFYMHDTTSINKRFWPNISRWCSKLPACALPLTRYYPSSSMGLYDAQFLFEQRVAISELKNKRGLPATKWKTRGFGWEDKVFKLCDAASADRPIRRFTRQCWNSTLARRTCICSSIQIDSAPQMVYGPGSAPRQLWRFPCAGVIKFKANFARNRTLLMNP